MNCSVLNAMEVEMEKRVNGRIDVDTNDGDR